MLENLRYQRSVIETGRTEGRAEGIQQKSIEVARQMKADGMPLVTIQKYTGLSSEQLEEI